MLHEFPLLQSAKYAYEEGPLTDGSCFVFDELWLNCQLLTHILLEELGYGLPKWLRSAELYRRSAGGRVWVDRVDNLCEIRNGDIFLFSQRKIKGIQDKQIYKIHLGVCTHANHQIIQHASRYDEYGNWCPEGNMLTQPLAEILRSPRYNTLVGIRRARTNL